MHLYAYHIKRIILENNVNTTQSREHFSAIKKDFHQFSEDIDFTITVAELSYCRHD